MSRYDTSWALFERAVQVIFENKKLLWFPLVVSVFFCGVAVVFLGPIAFADTGHRWIEAAHWEAVAGPWGSWDAESQEFRASPSGYVLLAGIYLVSMFLTTFVNVAFFNEILNALNGRPVSVTGGLRFAASRLRAILAWSLFAGLVGLIIRALEQHLDSIGRWILSLIGIAWSVASIFVVPVIIRDENRATPVRFLRTSSSLIRKTWGEALIGYAGLAFGGGLVIAALFGMLLIGGIVGFGLQSTWPLVASAVIWFVGAVAFTYVLDVAGHVYRAALYVYATEGVVPGPFDRDQMDVAWKLKTGRGAR